MKNSGSGERHLQPSLLSDSDMNNTKTRSPQRESRARRFARETGNFLFLLLGLMAARSTLADHYYVPSGSMEPTLVPGDRVVVDKMAYGMRVPFTQIQIREGDAVTRGEVVIFDSPRDGTRLIKRIVAIGGDEVIVNNGRLLINGNFMARLDDLDTEIFGERIVRLNMADGGGPDFVGSLPEGKLLAMGDHRGNSLDGRIFGLIDERSVYGRAIAVYFRSGDGFVWENL
jgi:signal peptidase I